MNRILKFMLAGMLVLLPAFVHVYGQGAVTGKVVGGRPKLNGALTGLTWVVPANVRMDTLAVYRNGLRQAVDEDYQLGYGTHEIVPIGTWDKSDTVVVDYEFVGF